jgi:hypothetical protein
MKKSNYSTLRLPGVLMAFFAFVFFMSSCSTTKYTPSFTASKTTSYGATKAAPAEEMVHVNIVVDEQLASAAVVEENLVASTAPVVADANKAKVAELSKAVEAVKAEPAKKMSIAEKVAVKKLEKQIKKAEKKELKGENVSQRARYGNLITGALLIVVGIILGLVLGTVGLAWIGTIVSLVGAVFLVIWVLQVLNIL